MSGGHEEGRPCPAGRVAEIVDSISALAQGVNEELFVPDENADTQLRAAGPGTR